MTKYKLLIKQELTISIGGEVLRFIPGQKIKINEEDLPGIDSHKYEVIEKISPKGSKKEKTKTKKEE
tara:strand:- start:309 stop:509 length:201 start_codon:yes stop_codon:yes gene_type:complete